MISLPTDVSAVSVRGVPNVRTDVLYLFGQHLEGVPGTTSPFQKQVKRTYSPMPPYDEPLFLLTYLEAPKWMLDPGFP